MAEGVAVLGDVEHAVVRHLGTPADVQLLQPPVVGRHQLYERVACLRALLYSSSQGYLGRGPSVIAARPVE